MEKRIGMITAATGLGFVVVQLDGSILNLALPTIGAALGAGVDALQWTVDGYFLVFAALLLSAGALGDRIGAKRAFIAGFGIFALSSLACALARSVAALVAFRAMQGVGAALLVPCSLALINHACGDNAALRARAIGFWTAAGGLGLAAGPVISGLLLSALGWRSIFLVNLPMAALGIWMAWRFAVETEQPAVRRGIDPMGQALAAVALLGVVWSVIEAGWFPGLVVAAVAAMGLVVVERRVREPAIPFGYFRDPRFTIATIGGFLVSLTLFGLAFAMSLYFQSVLHYPPAQAGLAFVPFAIGITVSNIAGGALSARFGARVPIAGGLLLGGAGFLMLAGSGAGATYWSMFAAQIISRFGCGLAVPAMTAALLSTVPRAQAGAASGLLNAIRQAGAAIGVALFGALMRGDMIGGLRVAAMTSAVMLGAAGIAALFGVRPVGLVSRVQVGTVKIRAN